MERWKDGKLVKEEVPLRNAMNEVLREAYIADNLKGIEYWNRECERADVDFRFTYPHRRFNRTIGEFSGAHFDPSGDPITEANFKEHHDVWLPTAEDRAYVKSLMQKVTERGKFAGWIAPPLRGIDSQEIDFEYVRL
jgi:benzoyl-CoA 2,3-dioxygenase component B